MLINNIQKKTKIFYFSWCLTTTLCFTKIIDNIAKTILKSLNSTKEKKDVIESDNQLSKKMSKKYNDSIAIINDNQNSKIPIIFNIM